MDFLMRWKPMPMRLVTSKPRTAASCPNLFEQRSIKKRLIEEHEQAAKDAKAELKQLTRELIPSEMQEMGLERIDVDGNSVTLNQFVYASIPEANKAEAFAFLRDIGEDDIIKNEVKVQFGKGQDNEAGAFMDDCQKAGLDPEQKTAIHPMTLQATIKEWLKQGRDVNLELFGAYVGTEAKIRRK